MSNLSIEEIVKIQIKLLQSSGRTLTTLHRHLLTNALEKKSQLSLFKDFDKSRLSHKLKKMFLVNIQSMGDDPNANLRVLSLVLLKLIYCQKQLNQDILTILKSHLHSQSTDLSLITPSIPKSNPYHELSSLSSIEMKKILVQFLHSLKYSHYQDKIQTQCKKYPFALQLLVILFRSILLTYKVPQAQIYTKKISTTASYEILFQYLDIFYNKSGNIYLLRDQNLFIQNGYQDQKTKEFVEEIVYGSYYENQDMYETAILKNMENPMLYDSGSSKFTSTFNSGQFNGILKPAIQSAVVEKVNPFQLMIPQQKIQMLSDSSHTNRSNRSLKSSNAFGSKVYNLASNRSQASINLQDSQCDNNPTPSFNQITEEDISCYFSPSQQSTVIYKRDLQSTQQLNRTNSNQKSIRNTNVCYNMKESATILINNPSKNKILQSSILEDFNHSCPRGSLQLEQETMKALGLKIGYKQTEGLDTADTPQIGNAPNNSPKFFTRNQSFMQLHHQYQHNNNNFHSLQQVLQQKNRQRQYTQYIETPNQTSNNKQRIFITQQDRKMMKRSQSQKNSSLIHNNNRLQQFTNSENKQSLFGIQCKKLKTSIQIVDEELYYNSYKILPFPSGITSPTSSRNKHCFSNYSTHQQENLNNKNFSCSHSVSNYSCSCTSSKISKNKIISKAMQFNYRPNNNMIVNNVYSFKKKGVHNVEENAGLNSKEENKSKISGANDSLQAISQTGGLKVKKLNDEFFKKLKAKRQELKNSDKTYDRRTPKNKSADKVKQQKKFQPGNNDRTFIKFSQFIKASNQRSISRSKSRTPQKGQFTPKQPKSFKSPTNSISNFKKLQNFFAEGKKQSVLTKNTLNNNKDNNKDNKYELKSIIPSNQITQKSTQTNLNPKILNTPTKNKFTPTKSNYSISPKKKYQKADRIIKGFNPRLQQIQSIPLNPSALLKNATKIESSPFNKNINIVKPFVNQSIGSGDSSELSSIKSLSKKNNTSLNSNYINNSSSFSVNSSLGYGKNNEIFFNPLVLQQEKK